MCNKKSLCACIGLTLLTLACTLFFVYYRSESICQCISSETRIGSKNPAKICECGQGLDSHAICQKICPWNTTEIDCSTVGDSNRNGTNCLCLDYDSTILQCGSLTSVFHMYPSYSTKGKDTVMSILFLSLFGVFGWIFLCCYVGWKYAEKFENLHHVELQEDQ